MGICRRSTFSGKDFSETSSNARKSLSRRATYTGMELLSLPPSWQRPQKHTGDVTERKSIPKVRNKSQRRRAKSIIQPKYRSRASSLALNENLPKSIRNIRDSLLITQPAERIKEHESLLEDATWVNFEQHKQEKESFPKNQSKQQSKEHVPMPENVRHHCGIVPFDKPGADFLNLMQTKHQVQLHHHTHLPIKSVVSKGEKEQISRPTHSTGDAIITNLSSAWYWSGYYAGYQQSLAEE